MQVTRYAIRDKDGYYVEGDKFTRMVAIRMGTKKKVDRVCDTKLFKTKKNAEKYCYNHTDQWMLGDTKLFHEFADKVVPVTVTFNV